MHKQFIDFLENKAYNLRVNSILETTQAESGHATSALSAADIVAVCFFYAMHFDPKNINNPNNDRFVLSKGHAAPILYAVWKELGVISQEELMTYRQFNSPLEGHPTPRFIPAQAATGSLGQGLSIGLGIAMAGVLDKREYYTYVLMGDGEIAEGSIWEAVEIASHYKTDHLIGIVDVNRLGQSDETIDDWDMETIAGKFAAFGWQPIIVDGHDICALISAFDQAKKNKQKPVAIIAKTIKGHGVASVADKQGFHGKPFKKDELELVLRDLKTKFAQAAAFDQKSYQWKPTVPKSDEPKTALKKIILEKPAFKMGELLATRKAYGSALAAAGKQLPQLISLDGDVKNSTFAQTFEDVFPERFIQCYIAEQNMIGMAVGLSTRGKIPFASTFAAFMTRAFDQIRMAAIGNAPLRLCGSHVGVSIGEDGPSQMGLEDIALFNTIPASAILYPCDAVSTYKLVELMANRNDGITYLRTTRPDTPVIYQNSESFELGGCKILRESTNDTVCIIAAGITVFEAIKAHDILKQNQTNVAIIDAYCIKPLATETIKQVAQKSHKKIITVEDHYLQGGLGQIVCYALRNEDFFIECLAVTKLPRSGKPEQLMSWEEIDAAAIVNAVKRVL